MIEKLNVRGFKSLDSVEIALGQVNVFIGANGSGKSNLLEAVGVLGAAAFGRVDAESLTRRGCRPAMFYRPMFEASSTAADTTIEAIGTDGSSYVADLASPDFRLSRQRGDAWQFKREVLNNGKGRVVERPAANGMVSGDPEAGLAALKRAELESGDPAAELLKLLSDYNIYTPDTPMLQGFVKEPPRNPVGLHGGGLAGALADLYEMDATEKKQFVFPDLPAIRDELEELLSSVDWFSELRVIRSLKLPDGSERPHYGFVDRFFQEKANETNLLGPNEVNEGMLYLLFVAVLCLHPDSPRLFGLDNADHGLNPRLVRHLTEALCRWTVGAGPRRQILMTTHNPLVLDGLPLQDNRVRLFTVSRTNLGRTTVRRVEITPELIEQGKQGWTLSRLWVMGNLGGVPNV
jgi:energy-coupling factor transporter ATP-binding protein EcfA2